MPDAKEISALTTAESTSASDLFETALPNAMTETGYISRKVTLGTIANFLLSTLQFSSLNTTVKNIIGAINELAQGSGQSLDALNDVDIDTQTLANGQGIVYDATAQKWKNGTVSGGGGHTYSTTEQVVGTWIDGSPVYEKTQYISALPSSVGDWVNYPHGISNFDRLISVSATAYSSNIPQQLNIPHVNAMAGTPTMVGQIAISVSETNIAFIVGQDRSSWEAYVTIRYTKSST